MGLQWPTTACLLLLPLCANIAFTKTHEILSFTAAYYKALRLTDMGRNVMNYSGECVHHKQESNFLSDHKNNMMVLFVVSYFKCVHSLFYFASMCTQFKNVLHIMFSYWRSCPEIVLLIDIIDPSSKKTCIQILQIWRWTVLAQLSSVQSHQISLETLWASQTMLVYSPTEIIFNLNGQRESIQKNTSTSLTVFPVIAEIAYSPSSLNVFSLKRLIENLICSSVRRPV